MAKTVIGASVEVDIKNSSKNIEQLRKEIDQLKESLNNVDKESQEYQDTLQKLNAAEANLTKQTESLNKSLDKSGEASKKTGGAFSKLGGALKLLGIASLISGAMNGLKTAFDSNSQTAGTLSAILTTIQAVFNKFIEIVTSVSKKVSETTKGFEGLTNVLKGLAGLIGGTLKLAFASIGLIIQEAQLAWEQSFFGDDDPETIKKLNKSIEQSKKSISEAANQAAESGKKIVTNIGQAVQEVGQVVIGVIDEAQKIDGQFIKNTFDRAKALEELKKNATLAKERLAGIRAEGERDAELLRQTRDNQNLSIEERIAANEKLADVLNKIQKASLAEADVAIKRAKAEAELNKGNVELQAAVIAAVNARKDIEAQITGQFSEQKANLVALNAEQKARDKAAVQGANEILFERKKANAEGIKDELAKNLELQRIRDEERKIEIKRLEENVQQYKKGTQARVDAENELANKKKELDLADQAAFIERIRIIKERNQNQLLAQSENELARLALEKQINEASRIEALTKAENAIEIAKMEAAELIKQINLKRDAEIEAARLQGLSTNEIREKYAIQAMAINESIAQSERDLALARVDAAAGAAEGLSQTLGQVAALLGEGAEGSKEIAIATATIDTFVNAVKAYKSSLDIPIIGPYIAPVNAALAVAAGIAQISKIQAVEIPGGNGGAGGPLPSAGGAAPTAPIPSPTVVAQTLNTQAINQLGNQSMRAYVLNSDMQNNDQRNAYLQRNARIG